LGKTILITGGCGFVGSNLSCLLKEKYESYTIIALDNLKRSGSELNINRLKERNISFVHGDIRNKEDLIFDSKIDIIIDAAAEPSVLAGLDQVPDYLIHTNFNGTINLLNTALKHKADFMFLSTSRVYPIHLLEALAYHENEFRFVLSEKQIISGSSVRGISELFPLEGARSLYGATKLASEILLKEYQSFYNLKGVVNRCGVLTGPYQMGKVDQGVIVLWMARHFWKKDIKYIGYGGEGKQVRDILHIKDLFSLVDFQIHNMEKVNGKVFNVGGGTETSVSLRELTDYCARITGNVIPIEKVLENRVGDIPLYITDNSRITSEIGWEPTIKVENILLDVFEWIKANEKQLKPILN
jgi:CDP-paratose 2-epimerase